MKLEYTMNTPRDATKMIIDQIIFPAGYPEGCKHACLEIHKIGHITDKGNWSLRCDHVIVHICGQDGWSIDKEEYSGKDSLKHALRYIRWALKNI